MDRAVAAELAAHFARHGSTFAPDPGTIDRIVGCAFWASLRREEGRSPTISLAYLPPDAAGTALRIERPLPLEPATLTKLSPAVERPGIHLGVWQDRIWGATRTIPPLCFVVEVIEPGLLVVKHRRAEPDGKFANVAVLEGEQIKFVDAEGTLASECPDFVATLLGFDRSMGNAESVLLPLALSMRAHKHGGSLLVVPAEHEEWRKSIVSVPYRVSPPFARLRDGPKKEVIDAIGGLTAVDGAVVMNKRGDVLAFGAKIARSEAGAFVDRVLVREPIRGTQPATLHPSELGGTRHLSAAQFVHEQRDALALVASQDGRFTVFGWSTRAQMVHAYRVEALLL